MARKPPGYWDNFSNIEKDIFEFISLYGKEGIMPTSSELYKNGYSGLATAIQINGGLMAVAHRLNLERSDKNKPKNYWNDFSNIKKELLVFIKEHGEHGVMPSKNELTSFGYNGLINAIRKHGGTFEVARKLGLQTQNSHKSFGYWKNFSNLEKELLAFVQEHGEHGVMPTRSDLEKAERRDLIDTISKNGGPNVVAQRIGLSRSNYRRDQGYWNEFSNIEREIQEFIVKNNLPKDLMPTTLQFDQLGPSNLSSSIRKHGGVISVAQKIGLKTSKLNKPQGYWNKFEFLQAELLEFIKSINSEGRMPSFEEFEKNDRVDLHRAMQKHGGQTKVAQRLGLSRPSAESGKILGFLQER